MARSLFEAAIAWLQKRDLTKIQGPVNPSTNHEAGLLIEGFDSPPVFMMSYNPPYYAALLEASRLTKAMDLNAYHVDRTTPEPPARFERVKRLVDRVKFRGDIIIRKPDLKRFDREAQAIKYIYHRAWSDNWGFVPWTDAEFDHQAAELKQLIVPEFARIIEVDGRPAAFGIMLPDYNEAIRHTNGRLWPFGLPLILAYYKLRRIRGLRMFALGVVEEHRKAGLEAMLMHDLYLEILNSHYQNVELSWTLEVNTLVNNAIEAWGCRVYKRYRIYEKDL